MEKVKENTVKQGEEDKIMFNFHFGAKVEIHGHSGEEYKIEFINSETNEVLDEFTITPGHLAKATIQYYIPWRIKISKGDEIIRDYTLDLNNKNVLISFESSAMGDTISWFPYLEEFRKKHNCKLVASTFFNSFFKETYPDIHYIEKGTPIKGVHYSLAVGWFGDGHASEKNKRDCHLIPLQALATDVLGLEYEEKKPKLTFNQSARKVKDKYVTITTCSTAQFKFYNRPGGWDEIVSYLTNLGYKVVAIGKQPNYLKGVINFTGKRDLTELMNMIHYSDFFIGLPSGLAWLSWALNKKTVMITGISKEFCEYRSDNYRVTNEKVCNGCFNFSDPKHAFVKSDWMFCPLHKNTERHFECTKQISPKMVFEKIELLRNDLKNKKTYHSMSDEDASKYEKTIE